MLARTAVARNQINCAPSLASHSHHSLGACIRDRSVQRILRVPLDHLVRWQTHKACAEAGTTAALICFRICCAAGAIFAIPPRCCSSEASKASRQAPNKSEQHGRHHGQHAIDRRQPAQRLGRQRAAGCSRQRHSPPVRWGIRRPRSGCPQRARDKLL